LPKTNNKDTAMADPASELHWHRVAAVTDLPDGRVMTARAGTTTMALTHVNGVFSAMDITHILLNNSELGKISKEQAAGEWPVWETSLHNPNFASYAKLCGGFGVRVKTADELRAAIQQGLDYEGPAIIEVVSDVELI
jgi:thiamine pyrophosphate-dependent acetolactate synthase large subunit-like protein